MANRVNPGYTFDAWLDEVDKQFTARMGLSIHDVEDMPFDDWYTSGISPSLATTMAIKVTKDE